jgi:hypothetical protein
MQADLNAAFYISLIGMSIVFIGMLLMWLLMAVLVRLTSDKERLNNQTDDFDLRSRAALAAVTVALANQAREEPQLFPLPPAALVSPWQAVTRANRLGRRSPR